MTCAQKNPFARRITMLSAMHALPSAPTRQRAHRTQWRPCAVRASSAAGDTGEQRRQAVAAFAALTLLVATPQALAIPQTSACATNSCDDFVRYPRPHGTSLFRNVLTPSRPALSPPSGLLRQGPAQGVLHEGEPQAGQLQGQQVRGRRTLLGAPPRSLTPFRLAAWRA